MRCQCNGMLEVKEVQTVKTTYECRRCHTQYAWTKVERKDNED